MAVTVSDDLLQRIDAALGSRFAIGQPIAASAERLLFRARDRQLKRPVSLRINIDTDDALRRWFLKEAEALARLDHPAIRHAYEAGVSGGIAYRVGNWIQGESLSDAIQRGPRPIPAVHVLARDLLSALEHAHANGVILRRIVPASLLINGTGHGTVTDLRFCNLTLPEIPPSEAVTGTPFLAPEIRYGYIGDPASDVYTAGAVLYFALTATTPPLEPSQLIPPSQIRPVVPRILEQVIERALSPDPDRRFLTAVEMLESFISNAGEFTIPRVVLPDLEYEAVDGPHWEARLRRALGDDYELLGALGRGGFGRVYRVRDLHLEREVALKVLHPQLTQDPAVVERFRREAQLAARLAHPHIVDIYDIAGRSGLIWYTMEIVDGPNLAQLVDLKGPLPVDRVVRLLRESLSALGHAHSLGLVHRDIKPENLLIERDQSIRISDFGLAIALRGQGRFGGATSQSGTPQYASPEQLLGEQVDQRTDLYSLAAVAFFALTGKAPFTGSTVESILVKQTRDQFPDLTAERDDVGRPLTSVLERALRNDVRTRWATAGEFRDALEEAVERTNRKGPDLARLAARILGG